MSKVIWWGKTSIKHMSVMIGIICLSSFCWPSASLAAVEYAVTPLFESEQDSGNNVFELKALHEQTIRIEIENKSDQDKTFSVTAESATTNQNGIINYSQEPDLVANPLAINFNTTVSPIEDVLVKKNDKRLVLLRIKLPTTDFDGLILGGIRISEGETVQENQTPLIKNSYSYVIPVKIRSQAQKISPELTLKHLSVTTISGSQALSFKLVYPTPEILREVMIRVEIKELKSNKIKVKHQQEQLQFAPNSLFDYLVLTKEPLSVGAYSVVMEVTSQEGNWHFEEKLTLTEKAGHLSSNYNSGKVKCKNRWLKIISGCLTVGVLVVWICKTRH